MDTGLMPLEKLQNITNDIFGSEYIIKNSERLLGGAQKHVYKITCVNKYIFVLYIWDKSTTYFADSENDSVFTSNSASLFEINNDFMIKNNIQTPKLYFMDRTKVENDFEFALVEYIDGCDFDVLVDKNPERIKPAFQSLSQSVKRMNNIKRPNAGTVHNPLDINFSCRDYIFCQVQKDIDYLINNYSPIKNIKEKISDCLTLLYNQSAKVSDYSFIHYELGPNHVIVDKNNIAYLIDIEGAKFFDLEYEHSFLSFRFGENYKYLVENDLDSNKLEYYSFCHFLGILSGAYELSTKNYYDMEDINGMINFGYDQIKHYCNKYVL